MIYSMFKWLFRSPKSAEVIYYSNATDLVDLELRMRKVQRGQAPFQKTAFWC